MCEDDSAVAGDVFRESNPLAAREQLFELALTLFEWRGPQVFAVQLDQVEGIQENARVVPARCSLSKSDLPSFPHHTASPSITIERTRMSVAPPGCVGNDRPSYSPGGCRAARDPRCAGRLDGNRHA